MSFHGCAEMTPEQHAELSRGLQPQRCRRDDIDRVNICTCGGCEMYRDQNYKLRVGHITRRDDERFAREYAAARSRLTT